MLSQAEAAEGPVALGGRPRSGLVTTAMCLAVVVMMMNTTSIGLAIPEISRDIGADQTEIQWIVDSYLLVLAAMLLPAGALLDRFGRRRGLLVGMVLAVVTFAWNGLAGSAPELIVSRSLAGLAAALVLPATLATITTVIPSSRRGMAVGLWAGSMTLGGFIGVFLGGYCLSVAWWGSIFLASAVAAVLVLLLAFAVTPETRDPEPANLDGVGAVLSTVGIAALVLGITEGPVRGWGDPLTAGGLMVGPLVLVAFAWWELHTDRPMLDLRLFRDPSFSGGTLAAFVAFIGGYGWFFMVIQYLAFVLAYDALDIGIAILPVGVLMVPMAVAGPVLARRFGRRPVLACGLLIMTTAASAMALLAGESYWPLYPCFAIFLGGLGLLGGPATEAIVESLPPSRQGVASAVNDVARELGAALGIAVVGSAFNAAYRGRVGELLGAGGPLTDVVQSSPAAGLGAAAQAGDGGRGLVDTVHHGVIAGWTAAWVVVAVLCVAGAAYVAARFPAHQRVLSPVADSLTPPVADLAL